jgi:AmmeMemoRadiSam system protein A
LSANDRAHPYVSLARETVRRNLEGDGPLLSGNEIDTDESLWAQKKACFVSIKTLNGNLRGCIGTIAPIQPSLDREIMANAISASSRDPRFGPLRLEELDGVTFSVDVLSAPEAVSDISSQLDPRQWGVIVSKGYRRGVLLPDLEGVDTVQEQLEIAAQKAGISDFLDASIERFSVDRYKEA